MYPSTFKYFKVKIIDKEFVSFSGKKYSQTACLSFFNEYKHEIYYTELGYIHTDEIYRQILSGEAIDLNEAYIENFDIDQLKNEANVPINILNFSAERAVFNAHLSNNFSNAVFTGSPVSFAKSLFIRGNVVFDNCLFEEGNVNFNSAVFYNGNVSFYNANFVKGTQDFKNCYYGDGVKNFQYVFWGNGDVLFANTSFGNGNVSFVNASFGNGNVNFKVCTFGNGTKDFKFAIFGDVQLSFERTVFGDGAVDFAKAEFGASKINFNKASFGNSNLIFDEVEIYSVKLMLKSVSFLQGKISFDEFKLKNGEVYFDRSEFNNVQLSFFKAEIKHLSFEGCRFNSYTDLRMQHCNYLNFSDVFVHDIVDLSFEENPTAIKTINLFGCRLMGSLFLSWDRNNVFRQIKSNKDQDSSHFAWQFNLLKRNFNNIGQYDDEDKAYVAFRREELAVEKINISNASWFKQLYLWLGYYFKKIVFDKMGLYATSPLRVFESIVVIWAFFGVLFSLLHFLNLGKTWSSVGNPDHMSIISQSFYHSAITFFTIGYGDVFPQGLSRIISSLEGFVGVFMMSYFTVAFVRKVLR